MTIHAIYAVSGHINETDSFDKLDVYDYPDSPNENLGDVIYKYDINDLWMILNLRT